VNRAACRALLVFAVAVLPGCSLIGAREASPAHVDGAACECSPCGDQCGLSGIACCAAKQSCALVHVLFSDRWEGGYPNGSLHGWRGSWCGCCGDGSLDTTHPTTLSPYLADNPH
jgi:hypothetical protein